MDIKKFKQASVFEAEGNVNEANKAISCCIQNVSSFVKDFEETVL